jgi:hypothetical protein
LLRLCLDVILQVCSLPPSRHESFLRSAFLGQGVVLDHQVFLLSQIVFILYLSLKLCNRIQNQNCNKVQLLELFICLIVVCDVLCVVTLIMAPRNDTG